MESTTCWERWVTFRMTTDPLLATVVQTLPHQRQHCLVTSRLYQIQRCALRAASILSLPISRFANAKAVVFISCSPRAFINDHSLCGVLVLLNAEPIIQLSPYAASMLCLADWA